MKRLLMLATACMVLTSCGTFRKVFKSKESHSVKVEQTSTSNTTTDRLDKSITTITEKVDTTVTIPGKTVAGQVPFNMDSLVNGMTAIKNELIDVKLHLNPITGVLSAVANIKPAPISVHLDKTITVQNDITLKTKQDTKTDTKISTNYESSEVKKEPAKMGVWIMVSLLVLLFLGSIIYWRSKGK